MKILLTETKVFDFVYIQSSAKVPVMEFRHENIIFTDYDGLQSNKNPDMKMKHQLLVVAEKEK